MLLVREGDRQDFRVYLGGRELPKSWCARDPEGLVAFNENIPVAVALVTVDVFSRTWLWFDEQVRLPAIVLHRRALELLNVLCATGRPVYAFVHTEEPGAEKWLRRLGFIPAGMVLHPTGKERLAWVRH